MYDFVKQSKHIRVSCNICFKPLFDMEVVTNFNRPRYGKIKKYRNFIKYDNNHYECEKCAGVVDVVCN